ncbi:hypothetical protein [Streptomyces sp. NPDC012888]|uniref:hypothetical protein n=1 Tax=Streptomyces sp. NPDC012888 TaxID=3364855 RepID=UPI0036940817
MSSSETGAPPVLRTPDLEPVPVPGCPVCEAAARHRETVRLLGSAISLYTANKTIRQHPHRRAAGCEAGGGAGG